MSEYLPIAEHGVIGDLHSVALVGTDGTIDWFCCPRFDSPSVFASILDSKKGGFYRIAPANDGHKTKQLYFPDTNVLITRFLTPDGVGEVHDFMPIHRDPKHVRKLVRRVVAVRGEMEFEVECRPRFDYGRQRARARAVRRRRGVQLARFHDDARHQPAARAKRRRRHLPLHAHARQERDIRAPADRAGARLRPTTEAASADSFNRTVRFWRGWLSHSVYRGRWREMVNRSALTLKLLTYRPTGAIVAARPRACPSTSAASATGTTATPGCATPPSRCTRSCGSGFTEEAEAFITWLTDRFGETDYGEGGPLQIMYGIDGRSDLTEEVLDHLEGYEGSAPVRIGNGAATQLQLDIYGELIDSIYLYNKYGEPISYDAWMEVHKIVEWLCENWDQPDEGIWETRGGRQDFTYSRLMCWVAIERAVRVARFRGLPANLVKWTEARDRITEQIMTRGWNPKRNAFVQHYGSDVLDASLLLMPLTKFIAPKDPRWLRTLDAIGRELVSDSLVYRYNAKASPDGLQGDEGTFSICTFWYVEALARAGQTAEARLAFEKMLTYANHLGLYSEEIGPPARRSGTSPRRSRTCP